MHSWYIEVLQGSPYQRVFSLGASLLYSLPLGFLLCLHSVLLFSFSLYKLGPLLGIYSLSCCPPPLVGKAYLFLGPLCLCGKGFYQSVWLGGSMTTLQLILAPKILASLLDELFYKLVLHLEHVLHSSTLYKKWQQFNCSLFLKDFDQSSFVYPSDLLETLILQSNQRLQKGVWQQFSTLSCSLYFVVVYDCQVYNYYVEELHVGKARSLCRANYISKHFELGYSLASYLLDMY